MRNWDRYVAGLLALIFLGNGVAMLVAPLSWYDAVPGVPATGPFNPHFVRDIGCVYVMGALSLGWFAWRPAQGWAAVAATAAWLTFHALVHVYDAACGASPLADFQRDFLAIYVFAAIPLALTIFRKPKGA